MKKIDKELKIRLLLAENYRIIPGYFRKVIMSSLDDYNPNEAELDCVLTVISQELQKIQEMEVRHA